MLNARIMLAGAAMVAGAFASSGAHAECDARFAWTCSGQAEQAASAKPDPEPAVARRDRASKRQVLQARASARNKKHASARKPHHAGLPGTERRGAPAAAAQGALSAATRRFREVVSPRPISSNPIDDLRKPRPDASTLLPSATDPQGVTTLQAQTMGADGDGGAAISQAELNDIDIAALQASQQASPGSPSAASDAPRVNGETGRAAAVAAADQPVGNTAWLQLVFVAWGGILTIVSVLRLFIG